MTEWFEKIACSAHPCSMMQKLTPLPTKRDPISQLTSTFRESAGASESNAPRTKLMDFAVENVDSCIADPTEGVDNLFAQLDTNEDGTIVKQEWLDNGHLLFSTPDIATEVQDALKFADDGAVDTNDDCCIM